jgi:transposase
MVEKRRRYFTRDYKDQAVRLARSSGRPLSRVAVDLGLQRSVLQEWVDLAEGRQMPRKNPKAQAPVDGLPQTLEEAQREIRRLQKQNKRLEEEREILKKAAAFFAKENG